MGLNFGLIKFLLILALVDRALQAPSQGQRGTNSHQQDRTPQAKLVEFKLPVKITSMHDLVAWARNAMHSMASRIDITLESVGEPVETKKQEGSTKNVPKDSGRSKQKESPARHENRRPSAAAAVGERVASHETSLLEPEDSFETIVRGQNDVIHDGLPHGNLNAYLPYFLDDAEVARYREEALRKYYLEKELARREKSRQDSRNKSSTRFSQAIAQQTSDVRVSDQDTKTKTKSDPQNENKKHTPVISVPFEAIVTITREHPTEQSPTRLLDNRDPPDEFPPYFERDYPRREAPPAKIESATKIKEPSKKRQIATLGDLLKLLGLTRRLTTSKTKKGTETDENRAQSNKSKPRKPAEKFTPPPIIQFEDQPQRQRRNETSQRQEFDDEEDDEEEPMGSLGSITDLLPLVIPILEDISDPNTETDLGELLEAALPLVQGLSEPSDDPDAPDILGMIGPILTTIIGGRDGQGSDVAAVLGPLITLIAPLIGPVLGPLVGPLLGASSNPPQGEGSSLATLLTAVLGPLTQPTEPGGMSPLSVLTAGIIAALSKELKPGLPGGLDVGALVGSVLSGVIAGTSAGLSGGSSSDKGQPQPYGPYGAGPVQAGSVNTGTSAGFVFPGPQVNPPQQISLPNQQLVPVNTVEHHRIVHHTTRRPYSTLPQRIPPGPPLRPPPPSYIQAQATGPLPAGTTNADSGGSSYLPYGPNNAVPANSVNPIGLISNLIKDILGAGIQVASSVINAVFGISGASSSDDPKPVYGPPPPPSYGYAPK